MRSGEDELLLGPILQEYFSNRLVAQREASPATIASYRDTFRLLLRYTTRHTGKQPADMSLADIDAPLVLGFLDHLERSRGNSVRTRNARFAAIRSFMHFASFKSPSVLPVVQRVLAVPMKRFDRPVLGFMSRDEVSAVIAAPDLSTWSGRRDNALFSALYNTGARISEALDAVTADVSTRSWKSIELRGKGRKA